jgi:hypothetical protein
LKHGLVFLAGLVLGAAMGLAYGWVVSPVQYTDASPGVLRPDFRNDYVLMVAESYLGDHDLRQAASELSQLGQPDLAGLVRQTAAADQAAGYAPQDLERLKALADDLGRAPLEFLPTP